MNESMVLNALKKTGLFYDFLITGSYTDHCVMRLKDTQFCAYGGIWRGGFKIRWIEIIDEPILNEEKSAALEPTTENRNIEYVLENIDSNIGTELLFHLDLFNQSFKYERGRSKQDE
jgi:hypothetical protein